MCVCACVCVCECVCACVCVCVEGGNSITSDSYPLVGVVRTR